MGMRLRHWRFEYEYEAVAKYSSHKVSLVAKTVLSEARRQVFRGNLFCACLSITKTERKSISDGTSEREYQFPALSTPLAVISQSINAEWTTKITSQQLLLMFWAQC